MVNFQLVTLSGLIWDRQGGTTTPLALQHAGAGASTLRFIFRHSGLVDLTESVIRGFDNFGDQLLLDLSFYLLVRRHISANCI